MFWNNARWAVYMFAFYFYTAPASCPLYHSLARQLAAKRQVEILTNNLANKFTTGFIEQIPLLVVKKVGKGKNSLVDLGGTIFSSKPCIPQTTYRELDLTIQGEGFFKLLCGKEHLYTLDGRMYLSPEGLLINNQGFPFMDANNDTMVVPPDFKEVHVSPSGNISVQFEGRQELIGQIGVFAPADRSSMKACSGSTYSFREKPAKEYTIISCSLAQSNVEWQRVLYQIMEQERANEESSDLITSSIQLDKHSLELIQR